MTQEEKKLWYGFLRDYPVRFLRQKVIDNFVVDFYCSSARLVIELDGSQHYDEQGLAHDKERTQVLEARGLTVIRFANTEVNSNFDGVCQTIDEIVQKTRI